MSQAQKQVQAFSMGSGVLRLAVHPLHLARYLVAMRDADARRLMGGERRAFMLLNAPRTEIPAPAEVHAPETERERERILTARLSRSSGFGQMILDECSNSCAVCSLQLSIVEGAHIIPVHDSRSRDERWNGICLCSNHHTLYDSRIIRIDGTAIVRVVDEDVNLLRQLNLLQGYDDAVRPFIDRTIRLPRFAQSDSQLHNRLLQAFQTAYPA